MSVMPYTVQSFIEIAERDARRGKDLSSIDPTVAATIQDLKEQRSKYWATLHQFAEESEERERHRREYKEDRENLRKKRDLEVEKVLQSALDKFQDSLSHGTYSWGLLKGKIVKGDRQTYRFSSDLSVEFPAKQAGAVVRRETRNATYSRNSIVRALRSALDKNYHHAVYRVDIRKFFDSIPHDTLWYRLNEAWGIDPITLEIIDRFLHEFRLLRGESVGVPQGVGLSSQLAEFYLRELDITMRSHPGVLFYARYVDDIIIVIEDPNSRSAVHAELGKQLELLGLETNSSPEKYLDLVSKPNGDYPRNMEVQYLGYSFKRTNKKLVVDLTQSRGDRRKNRLKIAFCKWLDKGPSGDDPNHGDEWLLAARVRFLAANTTLQNSKNNVAVGLYFSNSALESGAGHLKAMDDYLKWLIETYQEKMSDNLKSRLRAISFQDFFDKRTFVRYSPKKIERIVACWRNEH